MNSTKQVHTLVDVDLQDPGEDMNKVNKDSSATTGAQELDNGRGQVPQTWTEMATSHNWKWACSRKWTWAINRIVRQPILSVLQFVSSKAARNPKKTVSFTVFLSIALLLIGLVTNFSMEGDEDKLWTPTDTKADKHGTWVDDHSGFPDEPRVFFMFFHNQGKNALGEEQVRHIFEITDDVRGLKGYDDLCAESLYVDPETNRTSCRVWGVTKFWKNDVNTFEQDTSVIDAMSQLYFPDGSRVSEQDVYGYPKRDTDGTLTFVESYAVFIEFPDVDAAEDFEDTAIGLVLAYNDELKADPSIELRVEVSAYKSFEDEFNRAIIVDIPLIPLVFVIMTIFTMGVFFRKDRLHSRSFLGFCGVVAVLLSLATGYGLMFICGVVLTSMTQILPFIIFGIGLDDVFILTCAFDRTDRSKDPVERIRDTIDDIGMSIFMTSLTSTLAFSLGLLSKIPAIFWLCLYGVPTIGIVFVYQLTFFVGCMVLDEARIVARRKDCCCCLTVAATSQAHGEELSSPVEEEATDQPRDHFVDRLMNSYADFLLRPTVKIVVVILFLVLAAGMAYSTSQQEQAFDPKDLLPSDSYLRDFWDALDEHQARSGAMPLVYFRYVNQSLPDIQDQMKSYVNDLVTLDSIDDPPENFWLLDLEVFVNESSGTQSLQFTEQLDLFLSNQSFYEMYDDHIVRDENGEITASRCLIFMDNVDWDNVKDQINALKDQRSLTKHQPINQGRDDWAFFTYFEGYDIWELYRVSVEEIIKTTIIGVLAITCAALLLIPHWSAALVVFPLVVVLYIDLMGFVQICGVRINPISYIGLVMSVGLLVDFIMHVLLRYYESSGNRKEKTIYTLKTMGSSIFLGGTSSLLGTLPLAFSTSEMFFNIFIVFFGLVVMGTSHGLILLPVVLSSVGLEDPPVNRQSVMVRDKHVAAARAALELKGEDSTE